MQIAQTAALQHFRARSPFSLSRKVRMSVFIDPALLRSSPLCSLLGQSLPGVMPKRSQYLFVPERS
jgi:hypothetical protein